MTDNQHEFWSIIIGLLIIAGGLLLVWIDTNTVTFVVYLWIIVAVVNIIDCLFKLMNEKDKDDKEG